jgi:hypothetical protein
MSDDEQLFDDIPEDEDGLDVSDDSSDRELLYAVWTRNEAGDIPADEPWVHTQTKADNLAVLARGADLLVYDAAVLDPPGSPAGLYALHTAPKRIGEVAAAARVRRLLLSHLSPAVAQAQDTVLRSISASYTGPVRFATDCMAIDVTSRAPWNTAR